MLIKSKGLLSANSVVKFFTKRQEAVREDIKQTFAILKPCFHILTKPALHWYPGDLTSIMNTWIILHSMIVEFWSLSKPPPEQPDSIRIIPPRSKPRTIHNQWLYAIEIKLRAVHNNLTNYLIDHLWYFSCQNNLSSNSDDTPSS
jgi:hypothetical protein